MKRKQIYLPEEMDRRLAKVAAAEGVSQAALIRRALADYLQTHPVVSSDTDHVPDKLDPALQLIGLARGQGKRGSITLDDDLYGDDLL